MISLLLHLASKIEETGLYRSGETLFLRSMPSGLVSCIMIRPPLGGLKREPENLSLYKGSIQMVIRDVDSVQGEIKAKSVERALTSLGREKIQEGGTLHFFVPETEPVQFPRLDGDGLEFSQHFKVAYSEPFQS